MTVEDSAYAALGLRRGARRAEVDEAYRRLMKEHHPDRTGGDGSRAAEINRAYTLLRRNLPAASMRARRVPIAMRTPPPRRKSARGAWLLAIAVTGLVVAGLASDDLGRTSTRKAYRGGVTWFDRAFEVPVVVRATPAAAFDSPLHSGVIASAIAQAEKFHSSADMAGAADYSRDCHNRLRTDPNLALFDACAAFDESTFVLNLDEPFSGSGPFSGSEVMAREMAAARALSGDVLASESRLHQIRSIVELNLLPKLDMAAGQPTP